jgi:hypothetical protein
MMLKIIFRSIRKSVYQLIASFPIDSKIYFYLSRACYFLTFLVNNRRMPVTNKKRFNDFLYARKISGLFVGALPRCFADKLKCKEYISNKLGNGFTVPTISVLNNPIEVTKFIPHSFPLFIKPNHSSGRFFLVNSLAQYEQKIPEIISWLTHDYFSETLAEEYYGVSKSVIIEPYIDEKFKMEGSIHCIKGVPKVITLIDRFDPEKSRQSFDVSMKSLNVAFGQPYKAIDVSQLNCLDSLILETKKLAQNVDYVRVDFYLSDSSFLFGELTNVPSGASGKFFPAEGEHRFNSAFFEDY